MNNWIIYMKLEEKDWKRIKVSIELNQLQL